MGILPPSQYVDVNADGTVQMEISYAFDDMTEDVIRTERIFEVVNIKKKVSNAAIQRKKNWQKFGEVKNVPKGELERGVTNQRDGNFLFKWNGRGMQRKEVQKMKPIKIKKVEQKEEKSAPAPISKPTGYVPPSMRNRDASGPYRSVFEEEDKKSSKKHSTFHGHFFF